MRLLRDFLLLSALLILLAACTADDDTAALQANLDAMEAAIEGQRPGDFMDYVADDFKAEDAGMDHAQLRAYLVGLRFRHPNIEIARGPAEIELFGDRATVRVGAVVTGGQGLLPDRADQVSVVSHWQKVDGDWYCFAASWGESPPP